ncbi:MAG: hypothetical protein A2W91_05295 [Bacteroidetes bacterium GWF2_38_335]|nr:MAG: hypothetical protein A2W91_05295 [Bacteroidetes bacterium GWF2_38_335]OFY79756.1 MAG: hypothetical protein A2281_10125 [Bacteroidetes bacterium RIFOXYA12_FULL_38_20]
MVFLSLNRHSKSGIQNYHSEIWADKAGYYVYLPSVFIYNFQGESFPDKIDQKTGQGFAIEDNKIKTKYTYGVALMQSPFFLSAHILSKFTGYPSDGFSFLYHKAINISAVIYSLFSLLFLYFFLVRYISKKAAVFTVVCLYLGTNIFYYSIFETGMSHIYSFFLFSCYLYLAPFIVEKENKLKYFILFGLVAGLIIAVRPLNILFLPVFFIFHKVKISDLRTNSGKYVLLVLSVIIVIIPQLLYWKYSSGDYFHYSYGDEGFTNILSPKLIQLWFSTNNGLITYNPLIILILAGLIYYYKKSPGKSILIGVYFLVISLIFSFWHDWTYGCSFGSRPFVEYYSILVLPFGFIIEKTKSKGISGIFNISLIALLIIYNLKLSFTYDGCWYGGMWDFSAFFELLFGQPK